MLEFNVIILQPIMLIINGYYHKRREIRHYMPPIVLLMGLNLSLDLCSYAGDTKDRKHVELLHECVISKNRLWETL